MKALRSFSVRPTLPRGLEALEHLAMNLRWSWDERTRDLFRWVDPEGWDASAHDPHRMLGEVPRERLEALASDPAFLRYLGEIEADLQRYLSQDHWFQSRKRTPLKQVGYFSPEFGISETVPQYSGGLGILAGDHLKASSDLGIPLVGIGLLYAEGDFRQSLDADGWQQERFPRLEPAGMALANTGHRVSIDLAGDTVDVTVWRADVGRIPLYLLDAPGVTDRLYGGDVEHRLRQEMVLGIAGVRALRALG